MDNTEFSLWREILDSLSNGTTSAVGRLERLAFELGFGPEPPESSSDSEFSEKVKRLKELLSTQYEDDTRVREWYREHAFGELVDMLFEHILPAEMDELPGALVCWFEIVPVVDVFLAIGLYLSGSKYESSSKTVCVVSPSYEIAADVLYSRIGCSSGWVEILEWIQHSNTAHELDSRMNRLTNLLESCSGLPHEHPLHYSNLVQVIARRVLDFKVVFMGHILDRLCSRGYSKWVAHALLDVYRGEDGTAVLPVVLEAFPETRHGVKPFVTELLYQVSEVQDRDQLAIMTYFVPADLWNRDLQVRHQLGDVLLTKGALRRSSLTLLVNYLYHISHYSGQMAKDALLLSLEKAVGVLGGPSGTNRLREYQEKVLANFVILCLSKLSKSTLETRGCLIPAILKFISLYLESPMQDQRCRAMCVGNALSCVLTPNLSAIFEEDGLEQSICLDSNEEKCLIESYCDPQMRVVFERRAAREELDSDDDTDSEFGPEENLEALDSGDPERHLRLQEIVKILGQSEDKNWKDQLEALSMSEGIIKASPDELDLYAESLVKGIMYMRLPGWLHREDNSDSKRFELHRLDALLSLVTQLPEDAGSRLIDIFYSPSSNIEHRMKSLKILSSSAKSMSAENGHVGKVILEWSSKLLSLCDKPRHGIDMFGKDTYLLGCFICTLGNFLESLQGLQEALYLGTAVLRLVLSDKVRNNPETFVRRSALAAAARSISSVPASSVCASITEDMALTGNGKGRAMGTVTSREFSGLLVPAKSWFQSIANDCDDSTSKMLAQGCSQHLQLLVLDAIEEHTKLVEPTKLGLNKLIDPSIQIEPSIQIRSLKPEVLFSEADCVT
jgi:hypothetical protein